MTWECSECGALKDGPARMPVACGECGTAGVIFVPADEYDASTAAPEGWRAAWLAAGLSAAEPRL